MPTIRVAETRVLPAPPPLVYRIFADYRTSHPAILPARWLSDLVVEEGGVGDGTVIRFTLRVPGVTRTVRATITEPEPGRVLAETDVETGAVTTFTVDPEGGDHARVTIATEWTQPGLAGWIQRWFAPPLLRRMYREELANVERYAASMSHA